MRTIIKKPSFYTLLSIVFMIILFASILMQVDRTKQFATDESVVDLYDPVLEGKAKALLIEELTGRRFPPEVARWANVTITGTTVTIDTEKLNVWLGKNWESK